MVDGASEVSLQGAEEIPPGGIAVQVLGERVDGERDDASLAEAVEDNGRPAIR